MIGKAVPLVILHQIGHLHPVLPQGLHHLIRLRLLHPGIVRPLGDEERGLDLLCMEDRGDLPEEFHLGFGVPYGDVHLLPLQLPVGGDGFQKGEEVCHPHVIHPAGVEIRLPHQPHESGIPPVGAPVDGDTLGIRYPFFYKPAGAVGDIVLLLPPPLLEPRHPEGFAIPRGNTEVHLKDRYPPVGEKLGFRIIPPGLPSLGASVGVDHHGDLLGLHPGGEGEIAVDGEAVPAGVAHGATLRHMLFVDPGIEIRQKGELLGVIQIVVVEPSGHAVAPHSDNHFTLVQAGIGDPHGVAGKAFLQLFEKLFRLGVKKVPVPLITVVGDPQKLFPGIGPDDAAEIHLGMFVEKLSKLLCAGIKGIERQGIPAQIREDVKVAIIRGEIQGEHLIGELCGHDALEGLGFLLPIEHLPLKPLLGVGQAHLSLVIRPPPRNGTGVFFHQLKLPGIHVHAIDIEKPPIPLVHHHEHVLRVILENIQNSRAHPFEGGKLHKIRTIPVHPKDMVILVPTGILHVKKSFIIGPGVAADIPLLCGCNPYRLLITADTLHVDVQPILPGLEKGIVFPIEGEFKPRLFRKPEEILQRNQRRALLRHIPLPGLRRCAKRHAPCKKKHHRKYHHRHQP